MCMLNMNLHLHNKLLFTQNHICCVDVFYVKKYHIICVLFILQNPLANFVTRPVIRSFTPDQTIQQVSLPVNQDAFLAPGATITLSVTRAEVTSPSELAGGLGDATAPAQLVIGDDVANPIIFFDQRSLSASVNDCKYDNYI